MSNDQRGEIRTVADFGPSPCMIDTAELLRQPLQADPAKRGVGLMARPRERTLSSFLRVKPE